MVIQCPICAAVISANLATRDGRVAALVASERHLRLHHDQPRERAGELARAWVCAAIEHRPPTR